MEFRSSMSLPECDAVTLVRGPVAGLWVCGGSVCLALVFSSRNALCRSIPRPMGFYFLHSFCLFLQTLPRETSVVMSPGRDLYLCKGFLGGGSPQS